MHNEKIFQSAEEYVIPKKFDLFSNTSKTCEIKFYRCHACLIIRNQKSSQLQKVVKKKEAVNLIAAKLKAPLSKISTEGIKLTFQNYRLEN